MSKGIQNIGTTESLEREDGAMFLDVEYLPHVNKWRIAMCVGHEGTFINYPTRPTHRQLRLTRAFLKGGKYEG